MVEADRLVVLKSPDMLTVSPPLPRLNCTSSISSAVTEPSGVAATVVCATTEMSCAESVPSVGTTGLPAVTVMLNVTAVPLGEPELLVAGSPASPGSSVLFADAVLETINVSLPADSEPPSTVSLPEPVLKKIESLPAPVWTASSPCSARIASLPPVPVIVSVPTVPSTLNQLSDVLPVAPRLMSTPVVLERRLNSLSTSVNALFVTEVTGPCQPVAVIDVPLVAKSLSLIVSSASSPLIKVSAVRANSIVLPSMSSVEPPCQTMAPASPPTFDPPPH